MNACFNDHHALLTFSLSLFYLILFHHLSQWLHFLFNSVMRSLSPNEPLDGGSLHRIFVMNLGEQFDG